MRGDGGVRRSACRNAVGISCYSTYATRCFCGLADPCALSVRADRAHRPLARAVGAQGLSRTRSSAKPKAPLLLIDLDAAVGRGARSRRRPRQSASVDALRLSGKARHQRARAAEAAADAARIPAELQLGHDCQRRAVHGAARAPRRTLVPHRAQARRARREAEHRACAAAASRGGVFPRRRTHVRPPGSARAAVVPGRAAPADAGRAHRLRPLQGRSRAQLARGSSWQRRYDWREATSYARRRRHASLAARAARHACATTNACASATSPASRSTRTASSPCRSSCGPGRRTSVAVRPHTTIAGRGTADAGADARPRRRRRSPVSLLPPRTFNPSRMLRSIDVGPERQFRLTRLLQRGADFERRRVRGDPRADADASAGAARNAMPNRLAGETSPYLLAARRQSRRLVSLGRRRALGRARERQADPAVDRLLGVPLVPRDGARVVRGSAVSRRVMNDAFVNIKVDREERPDLDQIYQTAHALLTRRSRRLAAHDVPHAGRRAVLRRDVLPEGRPLRPARLLDLLPRVAAAYREQGAAIAEQNARLKDALASLEPGAGAVHALPTGAAGGRAGRAEAALRSGVTAASGRRRSFRTRPNSSSACARPCAPPTRRRSLSSTSRSTRMADGGIHDQLGGGFCRYSVDAQWTIPHFEKMLYDNGPLLALYADLAPRAPASAVRRRRARHRRLDGARDARARRRASIRASTPTARTRKASSTSGRRDEVRALVGASEWALVAVRTVASTGRRTSKTTRGICVSRGRSRSAPRRLGPPLLPMRNVRLARARATLFAAREKRVRPGRDDKILTSWNALAIAGLCAGRARAG